jgi:acetyl-CoA synthetase
MSRKGILAMLQFETTNRVLQEERLFEPTDEMREGANITQYMRAKGFDTYEDLHRWTIEHPEEFWAEMAKELHWFAPWETVRDWQFPYVKWFTGAKTNIVYNCLDRHRGTPVWNQVAIYWEGENGETRSLSYADLWRETTKFSDVLTKLGVAEGDKTCIYMPKIPEQFVAMLGTTRIGAAHSVVFSGFSSQALRDRIQEGEAKIVICADGYQYRGKLVDLKAIVDAAVRECPTVEHVIVVKRAGNPVTWVQGRDLWYDDLMNLAKPGMPAAELDSETPLYYLYTSGSTGKPKGIVHTHGGYMVGTYTTTKFIFDIKPDDIFWDTADPGWVTGHSYIVYGPMLAGCTQVFYEGAVDFPNPGRVWKTIEKYGVTILYTAPTAIRALMRQGDLWPASADLSSLRLLGSVGEPINPEAWMWYRQVTGDKHPIMDTWWQTETGAIMISPTPVMPLKPGSATKPFLGVEADVVDKEGKPVPEGDGGYLIIRQPWPSMMRTIYRDPERYETYWRTIPGVYFAGDSAYRDADGYFWIQGRVDDVIKKAGHRLGSSEIESALVSHPAVAEAAVIGKPDDVKGESIKAFVILKTGYSGSDALMQELTKHVRETVGPIAQPDELEFVPSLPKTRSGKIMRRYIKAQELGQPTGDLSTLEQ